MGSVLPSAFLEVRMSSYTTSATKSTPSQVSRRTSDGMRHPEQPSGARRRTPAAPASRLVYAVPAMAGHVVKQVPAQKLGETSVATTALACPRSGDELPNRGLSTHTALQ